MAIHAVYSSADTPEMAVTELKALSTGDNASLVIYFASSKYDAVSLNHQMRKAFPGASLLGCSTAGEIVSGQMLKNSIVAMVLDSDVVEDVNVQVAENVAKEENAVRTALQRFETYYDTPLREFAIDKYVGIVLIDGLSGVEEKIMERIGELTDIAFVGGAAGDDLQFKRTLIFANGETYTGGAAIALLKVKNRFDIIKTQSFRVLDKTLTATKVNEEERTVFEFNGKPAVQAYAEALGIPVKNVADHFMSHPVGLMVGDEPYVRSPQQVKGSAIVFYCNIGEGMDLKLLESTTIISDTGKAVEEMKNKLGSIRGIINFHCILRTLELEQKQLTGKYGSLFSAVPTVGFSTYGEEYIGHINQTSTMLVFG